MVVLLIECCVSAVSPQAYVVGEYSDRARILLEGDGSRL